VVSLPRWSFAIALGVALTRQTVAQDLCLPVQPPEPAAENARPVETPPANPDKTIVIEANSFDLSRDAPAELSNGLTIRYMGGTITAGNRTGRPGAVFTIRLPKPTDIPKLDELR